MTRDELLHKIKYAVQQKENSAEIYLYGSRARGNYKKISDWDLLILIEQEKVTNSIEDKFRDILYDIELEIEQTISILIYPKKYWHSTLQYSPLYKNIIREGIRL